MGYQIWTMTAVVLRMAKAKRSPADVERGRRVREAYERAGLTRQKVGEALGLVYQHVERIEKGQRVGPETLTRIAELCGVTERWLVRGPTYLSEFQTWLEQYAPADLHEVERETLASIPFPSGHHPGPRWYSAALETWRLGTQGSLVDSTRVRRKQAS